MLSFSPNILGGYNTLTDAYDQYTTISQYGALLESSRTTNNNTGRMRTDNGPGVFYVKFNASKSNSLYGNSSTIQPNSTRILFVIKY